jgi:hypothetical protein
LLGRVIVGLKSGDPPQIVENRRAENCPQAAAMGSVLRSIAVWRGQARRPI